MAPALRMTRSIKEKLPIFLCVFFLFFLFRRLPIVVVFFSCQNVASHLIELAYFLVFLCCLQARSNCIHCCRSYPLILIITGRCSCFPIMHIYSDALPQHQFQSRCIA
ncbi:hypothetical protein F5Y17DRAFT_438000, partial [Xylariaceae sp. FL0594]